jgi:hypothetical protein
MMDIIVATISPECVVEMGNIDSVEGREEVVFLAQTATLWDMCASSNLIS